MNRKTLQKIYNLNSAQCKRLISKGVIALPQFQEALKTGKIFIGRGSTNAYILEECYRLIGHSENFSKADYVMGQVVPGNGFVNWTVNKGKTYPEIMIENGKRVEIKDRVQELYKFHKGDLVLKGGNALDVNGIPGVLVGGANGGGTIGALIGTIVAKGIELICPISLEKMIFGELNQISQVMGIENMELPAEGMPCGMMPMPFATVMTEMDALETLFDCTVYHVASGGVGGAEGTVSLLIQADSESEFERIEKFMQEIGKESLFKPN
jgi:hypothetical protein